MSYQVLMYNFFVHLCTIFSFILCGYEVLTHASSIKRISGRLSKCCNICSHKILCCSIQNILATLERNKVEKSSGDRSIPKEPEMDSNSDEASQEIDEKWSKRMMQKGALHHESVADQLRNVLEHSMEDLIKKKTRWHSSEDLEKAQKFADYIRLHPLPTPRIREDSHDDALDGDAATSRQNTKRGTLTLRDYKQLVRALQDAVEREENKVDDGKRQERTASDSERVSQDARTETEAKDSQERQEPGEVNGRADGTDRHSRAGPSNAETFNPIAAAHQVQYVQQPGDRVLDLAATKGRKWVDDEILREHGEFVRLPGRTWEPMPVQPYYGDSI